MLFSLPSLLVLGGGRSPSWGWLRAWSQPSVTWPGPRCATATPGLPRATGASWWGALVGGNLCPPPPPLVLDKPGWAHPVWPGPPPAPGHLLGRWSSQQGAVGRGCGGSPCPRPGGTCARAPCVSLLHVPPPISGVFFPPVLQQAMPKPSVLVCARGCPAAWALSTSPGTSSGPSCPSQAALGTGAMRPAWRWHPLGAFTRCVHAGLLG